MNEHMKRHLQMRLVFLERRLVQAEVLRDEAEIKKWRTAVDELIEYINWMEKNASP